MFEWILAAQPFARVMAGFRGTPSDGEIYAVLVCSKVRSKWAEDILTR
ncbi:MAG: hypothetical protein VB815_05490 [Dehalococcoidia bacterium]